MTGTLWFPVCDSCATTCLPAAPPPSGYPYKATRASPAGEAAQRVEQRNPLGSELSLPVNAHSLKLDLAAVAELSNILELKIDAELSIQLSGPLILLLD